jgi:CO/xanthine dehydrogenase FAD-binding subunit
LHPQKDIITQASIALGNVSPAPLKVVGLEEILIGNTLTNELAEDVANLAVKTTQARDSLLRASASYRRKIVAVLTKRTLFKAYQRATKMRTEIQT